jgi:hypothetical protein
MNPQKNSSLCFVLINMVQFFQPIFQRYPRPEKEYQSFSLIYNDRSLDLVRICLLLSFSSIYELISTPIYPFDCFHDLRVMTGRNSFKQPFSFEFIVNLMM